MAPAEQRTRFTSPLNPEVSAIRERLAAERIRFRYNDTGGFAVDGITLELRKGEVVGLVGLAGSGKSTLGRLFKGLLEPDEGRITSLAGQGEPAAPLIARERMRLVGWTEAHPEIQFFEDSVRGEIAFGPANQGLRDESLEARIRQAVESVGLNNENILASDPRSLSGGEKRRVALASVAAMDFNYYIFDEPTAGLDQSGCAAVIALVRQLRVRQCGVLWLTHDIDSLAGIVDRLCGLTAGRLVFNAAADQIDWDALAAMMSRGAMPEMEF